MNSMASMLNLHGAVTLTRTSCFHGGRCPASYPLVSVLMFSAPAFLGSSLFLQHWAVFQDVQRITTNLAT